MFPPNKKSITPEERARETETDRQTDRERDTERALVRNYWQRTRFISKLHVKSMQVSWNWWCVRLPNLTILLCWGKARLVMHELMRVETAGGFSFDPRCVMSGRCIDVHVDGNEAEGGFAFSHLLQIFCLYAYIQVIAVRIAYLLFLFLRILS